MEAVIRELKERTLGWIRWQYDNDEGLHYQNEESDGYNDSPFWLYRMAERYGEGDSENYEDIPQHIRYYYGLALMETGFDTSVLLSYAEIMECKFGIREKMIKEAHKEKILMLYGKVPVDVMNEMLKYV